MKKRLLEHISGLVFVTVVLVSLLVYHNIQREQVSRHKGTLIESFVDVPVSNINDPFQRALLRDVMNIYYPDQTGTNSQVIEQLIEAKEAQFNKKLQKSHLEERLNSGKLFSIGAMFLKFLITYLLVMLLTYYGVQTLAVLRFILKRQRSSEVLRSSHTPNSSPKNRTLFRAFFTILKGCAYFILFSPAYVIAYSIKTEINTDSAFFMVILGVISNGLLVMYTNKFYAFLVAESRKGYTDTARVKNLHSSWTFDRPDGISWKAILHPRKQFKGHIFEHIFRNAHFQYLSTLKEQASFLITGLVIIEMALNIHGYLNYELLRQLLYKNYDLVIVIIMLIFYTVKSTELFTDFLVNRESMKYEN